MNFRLCTGLAAIACMCLASCYPYQETPKKKHKKTPDVTLTAEQEKAKAEEEAKKKAEEEQKAKDQAANGTLVTPPTNTTTTNPPANPNKPSEPKHNDYPVANKVPSKEGFVFSPYNNKVVDVRDIPSGTLVQDPTYPASEKKYFRVP